MGPVKYTLSENQSLVAEMDLENSLDLEVLDITGLRELLLSDSVQTSKDKNDPKLVRVSFKYEGKRHFLTLNLQKYSDIVSKMNKKGELDTELFTHELQIEESAIKQISLDLK